MKKLLPLVLVLALASCSQQDTLAALTATLGNAVATLVTLSGNPDLAQRLEADTKLAVDTIRAWTPGTSTADVIRSINVVIDEIQSLQLPEKYKPFVTLALGTAASIIDLISKDAVIHTQVRITDPPFSKKEFNKDWDSLRAAGSDLKEVPVL